MTLAIVCALLVGVVLGVVATLVFLVLAVRST